MSIGICLRKRTFRPRRRRHRCGFSSSGILHEVTGFVVLSVLFQNAHLVLCPSRDLDLGLSGAVSSPYLAPAQSAKMGRRLAVLEWSMGRHSAEVGGGQSVGSAAAVPIGFPRDIVDRAAHCVESREAFRFRRLCLADPWRPLSRARQPRQRTAPRTCRHGQ